MQSTVELFRHFIKSLPPLVPESLFARANHALEHVENDPSVTLPEVEDTMIEFGYELWPYIRAYREFLSLYEAKLGEHFLLPRLSPALAERYHNFKVCGGTLRDLHSGNGAQFFSDEERGELCAALVGLTADTRRYTDHQLKSADRQKFLERVAEFKILISDVANRLGSLLALADSEQDHPTLASEIRQRVRAFEYGLCYLGPALDYAAVCQAPEFFHGRRHELNRLRGIHQPRVASFSQN
ncbi:MAG: hypothetical protein Q7K39_01720 [Candidatus Magasanikbacteria bacterium]|nr:hypothetical protein [Candidatus Magasanikbacteria bacterium]